MYSIWNANSPSITEVEMWEVSILLNAVVQTLVQHLHTVWLIFFHALATSHFSPASELACWQNCDPFGLLSGSSWNRIHERSWRFLITSVMENGKIRRSTWSSCPWCLRSSCRRWPRPGSPPGAGPRCRTCPEHETFRLVWPPFSPLTSA